MRRKSTDRIVGATVASASEFWSRMPGFGLPLAEADYDSTAAKTNGAETLVRAAVAVGVRGDGDRDRAREIRSEGRRRYAAARRRVHQADPHADRADHLLHRGAWHRAHGRYGARRARGAEGDHLFRGADHDRAGDRARRGESVETRTRNERESRARRYLRHPAICSSHREPGRRAVSDEYYSGDICGRVHRRQRAAGSAGFGAVRIRADSSGRARQAGGEFCGSGVARCSSRLLGW